MQKSQASATRLRFLEEEDDDRDVEVAGMAPGAAAAHAVQGMHGRQVSLREKGSARRARAAGYSFIERVFF
jgi:hypothetical protein